METRYGVQKYASARGFSLALCVWTILNGLTMLR